eukprot:g28931.t1
MDSTGWTRLDDEFKDIRMKGGVFGAGNDKDLRLDEDVYDVRNFYKKTGCAQAVARSDRFERLTLMVISINAVYIGVDADNNNASSMVDAAWPYVATGLGSRFREMPQHTAEGFGAFAVKRNCLKDRWFVFDSLLVALMVAETWVLTIVVLAMGSMEGGMPTGMPLALVWGYTAYVSPGKVPWQISTLLGVTCACCAVTCAICLRWGIRDGRKSAFIVVTENRPMVPIYLELVRTIVMVPAIMSLMAVLCILRPSTSFTLQLLMAIFTCVVVGNMTRYFVALLGEPPMPQELLARVPKKRWWCGSCCGGVNDTCWGLGSAWSKVPHRVTLKLGLFTHLVHLDRVADRGGGP